MLGFPNFPSVSRSSLLRTLALTPLLITGFSFEVRTQNSPAPMPTGTLRIALGATHEIKIAGGGKALFDVDCDPQRYHRVSFEQRGIDVVVRLLDQADKVILDYDTDPRITGEEIVDFVTTSDKNCWLSIEPRQRGARQGTVVVALAETRAATQKDQALYEALRLLIDATRLWRAAKYDEALPLAERALSIRERELGPEHPDVGLAAFTVANIYSDMPDFKKSEAAYSRALEIRTKALGPDHFSLASIYNNFGALYKELGEYTKAESYYQRSLDIRERVLEPGHLLIASTMNNLAAVARLRGDDSKATGLYKKVLEMREKALGPDHPDVATALNNLANPDANVATAEPLYLRALAIREKALAPDHPDIAQTLYNLAVLYDTAGLHDKAEEVCERALAIHEKALGAEHPYTIYSLNRSAIIAKNKGDLAKAETLLTRAVMIREKVLGPFHPDLGSSFVDLANLYALRGEVEKAIAAQTRAHEIFEYNTALNLVAGTEREKLLYLRKLSHLSDHALTLSFADSKNSATARDLAFSSVLQLKGRVQDAMSDSIGSLRNRVSKQERLVLDDLTETNSKMATLVLNKPAELSAGEYQARLSDLEKKRDLLQRQLSQQTAIYVDVRIKLSTSVVRSALPQNTALLEFAAYRPVVRRLFDLSVDRQTRSEAFGPLRYVVFVLRGSGEVEARDLGEAKPIEDAIAELRQALRDPQRTDFKAAARKVSERILAPIQPLVRDIGHLLISPDGELNLMPFEALVDDTGQHLIEQHSITYLSSGRDLVRPRNVHAGTDQVLIIANPLFGEPQTGLPDAVALRTRDSQRRSITSTDNLDETYFAPIAGTAREGVSIRSLFPDSVFLTGVNATETSLKNAASPRVLHLATHGFFIARSGMGSASSASMDNPLLRSGLALAGANKRGGGADDGILTALEASGLNLSGTKLVVLSACDTGLGEIRNGEGVYGLRRSFVLAGAESLVMSLWPVSDMVTRELMKSYYRNLKAGLGRGEALRQVKLAMIKQPNRRHPFYWASFIQSGEWANLDGKR